MNKSGFTLIELLIATVLASIVATILFSALYQVNRFVPLIDNMTGIVEKAALLNAQLERDLSGVTVPLEFYARQPKKDEQKKNPEAVKKEEAQKKEKEAQDKTKKEEEKPKPPLEKVFYGVNKDGMLHQLSFITTNPLQVYWSDKSGGARPRMARVLYTLKPEPSKQKNAKKSYVLVRQESANLEFDALASGQSAKEMVVIDGIKSCTVEYTSIITDDTQSAEQEEGEKETGQKESGAQNPQAKKRSVKKNPDWLGKKEESEEKQKLPLVPSMVEFTVALWDAKKVRSRTYPFKIKIRAEIPQVRKEASERMMELLREKSGLITSSLSKPNTQMAHNNRRQPFGGPLRR